MIRPILHLPKLPVAPGTAKPSGTPAEDRLRKTLAGRTHIATMFTAPVYYPERRPS